MALLGHRNCGGCGCKIELKIQRDLLRKKYCSHRCRQLARWRDGAMPWFNTARLLSSTPAANLKKARRGPAHPRYKPDRTKVLAPRPRFENTQWKRAVLERDNFTCQSCGARGGRLQVDHIKPYCKFPELRWELSNGRALCVPCHKRTPTYGSKARRSDHAVSQ